MSTSLSDQRCKNRLDEEGEREEYITKAIQWLAEVFPFPKHENRDVWPGYLPHGQTALDFRENSTNEAAEQIRSRLEE
jgi:hypothetical protein